MTTREALFRAIFPSEPRFRWEQVLCALFDSKITGWQEVSTLSKDMREKIALSIQWMSVRSVTVLESRRRDTKKAVLECVDGARVETVLMRNARGHWSVCVSSQVGCAMGCTFCATGSMGFVRNLTSDEIVDQFRFWQYLLGQEESSESTLLSNVVFMGMGEPLANYDSVREAIRTLLAHTSLGATRITVSTVGLLPVLRKLLTDSLWPPVRLAVSLHSADSLTRKRIMPSSFNSFLDDLALWTKEYFSRYDERRRHLTFEYILLQGVNDGAEDVRKLVDFSRRVGKVKINLIPYNQTLSEHRESDRVTPFLAELKQSGIVATVRKAMGDDIAAACGQLVVEKKNA